MEYRKLPNSEIALSVIGLGGHEFLDDGRTKGMGEDFYKAVKPGEIWDGFGTGKRVATLKAAYDLGINFLDATMDSEKAALARNMEQSPPPHPVYIQSRPEGLVYNNTPEDTEKLGLLDYETVKAEAKRGAALLGVEKIGIYNFGVFPPAVDRHDGYIKKLAEVVFRLKDEGLIGAASVDTLSGERLSIKMIETGVFDSVFASYSMLNDLPERELIPAAQELGVALIYREVYAKSSLFKIAANLGLKDASEVAETSVKWIFDKGTATSLVIGAACPEHIERAVKTAESPRLSDRNLYVLDRLQCSDEFQKIREERNAFFIKGFS